MNRNVTLDHLALSSPPQLADNTALTLVATQNQHHGHLSNQIPPTKQSLIAAFQQLRKLPEANIIPPDGLLVFLSNALHLHAAHTSTTTPIIYSQQDFNIPLKPTTAEVDAALLTFQMSIEELQGFQHSPITGNSPPEFSPPREQPPSPPRPIEKSPSPPPQMSQVLKAVRPPDPLTAGLKTYKRYPKNPPPVSYASMIAEADKFAVDYPDETTRGGYTVSMRSIDKKDFNGEYFAPQPAWRQKLFQSDRDTREEYYRAPLGYRTDPRFHPIPRRYVWTVEHTSLTRGPINWPVMADHQKNGWNTELDIERATDAFYRSCYYSPDPHVREASAHCELLSFLLKRKIQFEQNLGPLIFNPNKPVPPQIVQRLYFRVCHLQARNVAQFERWQATQWLMGMNKHFGPSDRWDTHHHEAHRRWHWETELHNRKHKGGHWM